MLRDYNKSVPALGLKIIIHKNLNKGEGETSEWAKYFPKDFMTKAGTALG